MSVWKYFLCRLFRFTSVCNSCLHDSSLLQKRKTKSTAGKLGGGLEYIWLAVHAAVELRMLLIGLVGGKSLILNCVFSMGLN